MSSPDVNHILDTCRRLLDEGKEEHLDFVCTALEHAWLLMESSVEDGNEIENPVLESMITLLEYLEDLQKRREKPVTPGKPKIEIPMGSLEELLDLQFSVTCIAKIYGVCKKTIFRRLKEFGLSVKSSYTDITQQNLEEIICTILADHPFTGYKRMLGFLSAKGYRVTTRRVQEAMRVVDPLGVAERTVLNRAINRRKYFVRYAMDCFHLDTNMKLTRRYKMIIRSAIDGCSRTCIYLQVGTDNKARSHLKSFMDGVREWGPPRRIRCDKGGENYGIARFMLSLRGEDSKAVLAGRSVHNQRIERFWRDVYRDSEFFLEIFHAMEMNGILDIDNPDHLYILHYVFIPRIQRSYDEYRHGWNHHKLSTENNRTPLQLMVLKRNPELAHENNSLALKADMEQLYLICQQFHEGNDEPYDPVRNPSPVRHNLQPIQLERLRHVDCLRTSETNGVDIYMECMNLLMQGF